MQICVIKAGSTIVTQDNNMLDLNAIQNLCQQIIKLSQNGWKVILVSSGAVACGKGAIKTNNGKGKKQANNSIMASLGQGKLISYYSSFINTSSSNLDVGQILITRKAVSSRENYINLKSVILGMLEHNIIPVINENDAIGMHGISFTDNDQLASIIAVMVKAKICILLSEVDYVYTKNPNLHNDAKPINEIDFNNYSNNILIDDTDSSRGGMISKLDFFKVINAYGNQCILIGKKNLENLYDVVEGKICVGTRLKHVTNKKISVMKSWLATSAIPKGMVIISPLGAEIMAGKAKSKSRSNLYSKGICGQFGQFDKGDVVSVRDEQLRLIGIGRSKCSSKDLENKNYGNVFIHDNEFVHLNEYPFIDSDMLNIKSTLLKLRKRLCHYDDDKFIICPIGVEIDQTTVQAESITIKRNSMKDLLSLWRYAKASFKINFDEWLIYSALEGRYEQSE